MATATHHGSFLTQYLSAYLRVTKTKIIVWGGFLFPYLFIIVVFSNTTPLWIKQWVYDASSYIRENIPSPMPTTSRQLAPTDVDFEQLTLSYFLLTYLWSCIVVNSFAIIKNSRKRKHAKERRRK